MAGKSKCVINEEGRECSKCKEYKIWKNFAHDKKNRLGRCSICKACNNKYQKEKACPQSKRKRQLKSVYGITLETYNQMLEEQNHGCKLCGKTVKTNGKALAVDHCHATGIVRGLLCAQCNIGLGNFEDNQDRLRLAIQYLNAYC